MTPLASVAIPVLNDRDGLRTVLEALERQSLRDDLEVIVVDNGSLDGSFELARERADVAERITGGRGSTAARNRALEIASSDHLLTLDADTWPATDDWARLHLDALTTAPPDVLASAGTLMPAPSTDRYARRIDIMPRLLVVDGIAPYAVNGSACYRVASLRAIGGYPDCGANDAAVGRVAKARGLRYVWVPRATSYHRNEPGLRAYVRQMSKMGRYAAEQDEPPASLARWTAGQLRHALSRCHPLRYGDVREAALGVLSAGAQSYGALRTWQRHDLPERPWLAATASAGTARLPDGEDQRARRGCERTSS